jgi:hypothetical protein
MVMCAFKALVVAACAGVPDIAPVNISPNTTEARATMEKGLLILERNEKRINWPRFQITGTLTIGLFLRSKSNPFNT